MEEKPENNEEVANARPKASLPKKKKLTIIGGIVALVVVLGVGFTVWHDQPSFCNAICHTPMDPYLPTYEATPGSAAVDKWGNEVKNASSMLAATHRAESDTTCVGCHVPTLGEQVSEGLSWISGNYTVVDNKTFGVVLEEKGLEQLVAARGIASDEFCLNKACHNMTREDLVAATSSLAFNPHDKHHGERACSDCHKAHRASVYVCTECHSNTKLSEGWLTAAQASKLS